jgi:P4 family phage/plasmid primase-like protien
MVVQTQTRSNRKYAHTAIGRRPRKKNAKTRSTGTASDRKARILHVEVDTRIGGLKTLKRLRGDLGNLIKTYKGKTGDGRLHFYFQHPRFPVPRDTTGTPLGHGINVQRRADQPKTKLSKRTIGPRFHWVEGYSPSEVTLAELPRAWVQYIFARLSAADIGRSRNSIGSAHVEDVGRLVAQQVLDRFYAGGKHLVAVSGQLMTYEHGVWHPVDRRVAERNVLELLPTVPTVGKIKHATLMGEVVDLIMTLQARDDDLFRRHSDPLRVINCHNGELWLLDDGKVELRPHSASSFLEHQVNIDYDSKATCPLYDNALRGIFAKSGASEAMIRHWHELAGYIIQPQRDHALVVVLFGEGNNGKTRLIQTVERLLGQELVCAGRVEELESNKFSLASLRGKRMFVDDDVHDGIELPDGTLKSISENKLLTGELKYRDRFSFVSRIVPVLLCNNVPSLKDVSRGMLRRFQVVPFDVTFRPKTADTGLFDRIWATELAGVLNRAIEGWQRLHERKRFIRPKPVIQATRRWLTYANPLAGFLADHCSPEPRAHTRLEVIYAAFCQWLKQSGITRVQTKTKVKLQLWQLGYEMKKSNQGIKVLGLKLNYAKPRRGPAEA